MTAKKTVTAIWLYLSAGFASERAATTIRRHFRAAYRDQPYLAELAAYFPVALMSAVRVEEGFTIGEVEIDFQGIAESHFGICHGNATALELAREVMRCWKGRLMESDDGFFCKIKQNGNAVVQWPALAKRHHGEIKLSKSQSLKARRRWEKERAAKLAEQENACHGICHGTTTADASSVSQSVSQSEPLPLRDPQPAIQPTPQGSEQTHKEEVARPIDDLPFS